MPKTREQLDSELDAIRAEWDASTVRWDRLVVRLRAITAAGIVLCLVIIVGSACVLTLGTD